MTDKQILKKAIEKVIKNGWNKNNIQNCTIWFWHQGEHKKGINCLVIDHTYSEQYSEKRRGDVFHIQINDVIFSHDFAKAFWGKKWKDGDVIETPMSEILAQENIMPWQHHLRKMVLEEDRIKYLEQFLN